MCLDSEPNAPFSEVTGFMITILIHDAATQPCLFNLHLNFHWEAELHNLGNQNGGKFHLRICTQEFLCEIMQTEGMMGTCVFASAIG